MGTPQDEGFVVTLRDGTKARVRPIRPDDKWRLQEGLALLSPRSRLQRFHAPVERLTDAQLRYLTEVDHHRHEAWVAFDPAKPEEPGMGVGRYVRLRDDPHTAEAAIAVADRYQGIGLGGLLFTLVARSAIENGVTVLRNYVLASNEGMLDIFARFGATRTYDGGGVYVVDMPLPADPDHLPDTPAARVLRAAARGEIPPMRPTVSFPGAESGTEGGVTGPDRTGEG